MTVNAHSRAQRSAMNRGDSVIWDFSSKHIGKFIVRGADVRVNAPTYKRCLACAERATHVEQSGVQRITITRAGTVTRHAGAAHDYFCATHTGIEETA